MDKLESLKTLDLSKKESATYHDLLVNGESKTGQICNRTNIPSSHIYKILDELMEKGLVSYKLINNIKIFSAADPDALASLFDEKENKVKKEKKELLEYISNIKRIQQKTDRLSDFKYFEGLRGIKSLYLQIVNSWKRNDEYLIAAAPLESFNKLEGFFIDKVHKKRIKDKVKIKMLVAKNSKKWGKIREKMPYTQVRYLESETPTEYGVLNDFFFLISYGKNPYGLLIKDKNFAETHRTFFNLLWQQAENPS